MGLYLCDPNKYKKCRRKNGICQKLCILTVCSEYSVDGKLLTEEEVEKYEDQLRKQVEPGLNIGRHTGAAAAAVPHEEEPDTEIDAKGGERYG